MHQPMEARPPRRSGMVWDILEGTFRIGGRDDRFNLKEQKPLSAERVDR